MCHSYIGPHIGHSRHGLFFTKSECQSNAKPSEKDHDLPGTFGLADNHFNEQPTFKIRGHDRKYWKQSLISIIFVVLSATQSYLPQTLYIYFAIKK
jgi:hypothetical protein